MSLEGFTHTEMGAEDTEQRIKKIPIRRITEGRKRRAGMGNTGYFSLARKLQLKTTTDVFLLSFHYLLRTVRPIFRCRENSNQVT